MLKYDTDLLNTIDRKHYKLKCYDSLYFSSNEDFNSLFSGYDLKDKDIFSIIGSGDQSFYFYNQGARQVDLYDVNIVSIYYYILRIWCIKYLGDLYPKVKVDYIKKLLSKVNITNLFEENIYKYWNGFLDYISHDYELDSLFFIGSSPMLEKYIDDVSALEKILSDKKIRIVQMDITRPVNLDKKYDMVFVSNIPEYIYDIKSFNIYSENLDKLLKNDGVVIGSNIMNPGPSIIENKVLSKKFDYHNINRGYYYTKKR